MTDSQPPLDDALPAPVVRRKGKSVLAPGAICENEAGDRHVLTSPDDDEQLQVVLAWLVAKSDLAQLVGDAIEDAIYYVLDGWRTHRFDLMDVRVDSDERRALGTKLQYHVIENLGLEKLKHPDTAIGGVGVEIKGTISTSWAIPTEGQCGVTVLHRVDLVRDRHKTWIMRTHRAWLRDGANKDGKRGIASQALEDFAIPLYEWRPLRPNPLKLLTEDQEQVVFGTAGQERRLIALFTSLPNIVVPRAVILTVCANKDDPMRRVRAIRGRMNEHGYELLCGKWPAQREIAARLEHDLTGAAWVAVPSESFWRFGELTRQALAEETRAAGLAERDS
jgi:hypothetical protein